MKLTELEPHWIGIYGEDSAGNHIAKRTKLGVTFRCPDAGCDQRLGVLFANPPDGLPSLPGRAWQRTGDTFDTLTLTPSVDVSACGHWHGFITNGDVR